MQSNASNNEVVYFIYDGECPLCKMGASFYNIRESIGELKLIDARKAGSHPIMSEIIQANLNLDEGMVIKYQQKFYHGADALHLMATLGSQKGTLNRFNSLLYSSKRIAKLYYPILRALRNMLLKLKGVKKINHLEE